MEPLSEKSFRESRPVPPENSIFFGRFGLRAGWSLSIAVVLFLMLLTLLSTNAEHQPETASNTGMKAGPAAIHEAVSLAAVGLATLAMALLEHRRLRVYGIHRANLRDILPGAFWGLASLSLLVCMLRLCHALVFDARALHGVAIYASGLQWLLVFLLVGLVEEYMTRGFLQYTLTRGLFGLGSRLAPAHARATAFWSAAVIMSIVFGYLHLGNSGETASGILTVFCAGLLFSYALWRTGSLWWAIGFHTAWDWAQSFLYGVPDSGTLSNGRLFQTHPAGPVLLSGGADGPEGSVLVWPVLLLVVLVIRFTTRQGPQPPLEPEMPAPRLSIV